MRLRFLLVGAVAAAAMAAAPAALASGRNPQTAGLQVALRAQGLYRGPIDAISGPGTVAAVREFQRIQGLRVTGLADAATRQALGPLGRPLFGARTLHRGAFGWDVAVLQFLLVHHVTASRVAYRTQSVATVRALLDHWARHYGVSVHLVRALAWMESGYNNALVSSVGARGIMQLLPSTFSFAEHVLIHHRLRHNANGNVRAGVAYLAHLLRDFHGNRRLALAGWYQGERAVRTHGVYNVSKTFVKDVLALEKRM